MRDFTLHTMEKGTENVIDKIISEKDEIILKQSMISCPTLLTGMSHEVRTHMNAIVAFSFLMNDKGCNAPEREEFSNQILASCEQLIGLFDNFLDSAILETGNPKADFKVRKLNILIDELHTEFREILKKEEYRDVILVTENTFTDTSEIVIDSDRVFRVIRSLFQNALRNTKSGYIKIGYNFSNEKVTFYVHDSGHGYFKCKEFLQTKDLNESLLKYNDTGSAINLTLAKKLIHMLGGSLWIECNGLTGSGIYFSIPVKTAESSEKPLNNYVKSMIAI